MKILKRAILCFTAMISLSGCGYLNVDPELGMDDEDVFGTYSSFRSYFDWLYHTGDGTNKESIFYAFPMYYDFLQKYSFSWYNTTDMSDAGKMGVTQQYFKQGVITQDFLRSVTFDVNSTDKPLAKAMFSIIRRCNITIANIDRCADATEQEYNDLLGQAYALRGFCHFTLCRFFGGMPYLDHAIEADESWDLERESVYDTYVNAATDLKMDAYVDGDYTSLSGEYTGQGIIDQVGENGVVLVESGKTLIVTDDLDFADVLGNGNTDECALTILVKEDATLTLI